MTQVTTSVDDDGIMTIVMSPKPRPCFNPQLLNEGKNIWDQVKYNDSIKAVLVTSDVPNVFNLGGDLNLFLECVENKNWSKLHEYGMACVDNVCNMYSCPKPTIAVVQGAALGGGFEGALSAQYLVVERGSIFGFPESAFNLFPGMGAYSLLRRHLGDRVAKRMISSSETYTAPVLQSEFNLIDLLVDPGEGLTAAKDFARKLLRRSNTTKYTNMVQCRVNLEIRKEMEMILEIWVHAVARLTAKDIKLMRKLVDRQNELYGG